MFVVAGEFLTADRVLACQTDWMEPVLCCGFPDHSLRWIVAVAVNLVASSAVVKRIARASRHS